MKKILAIMTSLMLLTSCATMQKISNGLYNTYQYATSNKYQRAAAHVMPATVEFNVTAEYETFLPIEDEGNVSLSTTTFKKSDLEKYSLDNYDVEKSTDSEDAVEEKPHIVHQRILGSGVFITPEGHILTCAHLFQFGDVTIFGIPLFHFNRITSITVIMANGDVMAGEVIALDAGSDLALVKLGYHQKYPYAKLAKRDSLRVGDETIAIGHPLGLMWTLTNGIISGLHREGNLPKDDLIQMTTLISPGNSGGPLVNMDGEVIGINSRMVILQMGMGGSPSGHGLAVSIDTIQDFLDQYRGL